PAGRNVCSRDRLPRTPPQRGGMFVVAGIAFRVPAPAGRNVCSRDHLPRTPPQRGGMFVAGIAFRVPRPSGAECLYRATPRVRGNIRPLRGREYPPARCYKHQAPKGAGTTVPDASSLRESRLTTFYSTVSLHIPYRPSWPGCEVLNLEQTRRIT